MFVRSTLPGNSRASERENGQKVWFSRSLLCMFKADEVNPEATETE